MHEDRLSGWHKVCLFAFMSLWLACKPEIDCTTGVVVEVEFNRAIRSTFTKKVFVTYSVSNKTYRSSETFVTDNGSQYAVGDSVRLCFRQQAPSEIQLKGLLNPPGNLPYHKLGDDE